jgi:hypothetical protein
MKFRSTLLIILVLAGTIVTSCKKMNVSKNGSGSVIPNDSSRVDIYTAGYVFENTNIAAYWKNGQITKLGAGEATGIAVNGNDVYVVGYSDISNHGFVAAYWKNGIRTLLAATDSSKATGITIKGNDVYISGNIYISSSATLAVYWKNGALNRLGNATSQRSSMARTVTVKHNDVYVSGEATGKDSITNATYWKNGTAVTLNAGKNQYSSNLLALTLNGNDVYTGGQIHGLLRPGLTEYTATYWKNGIPQSFTDANNVSLVTAMVLSNNDFYVIGEKQTISQYKIVGGYWKNGLFTGLDNGDDGAEVHAAAIQGDDMYIGGSTMKTVKIKDEDISENYPCYWKNGKFVQLSASYGDVNSIVVVKK